MTKEEYKALRESTGLSREKFGAKLDVSSTTLFRREKGDCPITYEMELAIREIVKREKIAAKTKSITTEN